MVPRLNHPQFDLLAPQHDGTIGRDIEHGLARGEVNGEITPDKIDLLYDAPGPLGDSAVGTTVAGKWGASRRS